MCQLKCSFEWIPSLHWNHGILPLSSVDSHHVLLLLLAWNLVRKYHLDLSNEWNRFGWHRLLFGVVFYLFWVIFWGFDNTPDAKMVIGSTKRCHDHFESFIILLDVWLVSGPSFASIAQELVDLFAASVGGKIMKIMKNTHRTNSTRKAPPTTCRL